MRRNIRSLLFSAALAAGIGYIAVWAFSGPRDPLISAVHDVFLRSLHVNGYFVVSDTGIPDVRFFCICGPYQSCEGPSAAVASEMGYSRPEYNYNADITRLRQKAMLFTKDRVLSVEIKYGPVYFAREHESYCSKDLTTKIYRLGGK
jgi:hypothetical protein